jgi:hypothetical protein
MYKVSLPRHVRWLAICSGEYLAIPSLNEVSLPLGAQFQAIEDGLQDPGLDFLVIGVAQGLEGGIFSGRSAWVLPGVGLVRRCQERFRVVTMTPRVQFPRSESPAVGLLYL